MTVCVERAIRLRSSSPVDRTDGPKDGMSTSARCFDQRDRSTILRAIRMRHRYPLALCLVLLGLIGCTSIGPPTLRRDRLDYADAMAEASKRETLLNIIKLRYGDTPSMVTVNQLVAGYTLEGRINLATDFFRETFDLADDVNIGVGGTFADRPTITYAPIKGDDFARVMMNPIPPSELFAMVAAGLPADLILGLAVQTLNGLRNWTVDARGVTRVDARFAQVLELLGELRADGLLGFRFDTETGPRTAHLLLEQREDQPLDPRATRLIELLDLDPALRSFPIRFGFSEGRADEIRIYTRSLIEILGNLAAQVEVPPDDVAAGRTLPTRPSPPELPALPHLGVLSRPDRPWDAFVPDDPFVTVRYRDHWYWIDNADFESKRVFSALMLLLNLVDRGREAQLPVITIPTG